MLPPQMTPSQRCSSLPAGSCCRTCQGKKIPSRQGFSQKNTALWDVYQSLSWLVVYLPLWNIFLFVSWDDFPFPIWWESHNPVMFQSPPTRNTSGNKLEFTMMLDSTCWILRVEWRDPQISHRNTALESLIQKCYDQLWVPSCIKQHGCWL